jgi:uncharacterized membrane protein YfbV (UPF0208 family)
MKVNLAILAFVITIAGIVWQGSAKLTRMELALEGVPELRAELKQVREDVIVLRSHVRSWAAESQRGRK